MVRSYGMSPKLGATSFDASKRPPFLASPLPDSSWPNHSDQTARTIDEEVRRVLDEQEARVAARLAGQKELLTTAAEQLLIHETLSGEELRAITQPPRAERPA